MCRFGHLRSMDLVYRTSSIYRCTVTVRANPMFIPKPFQENRSDVLVAAINKRSLGTLVTVDNANILISHLPFVCVTHGDKIELIAHLARHNSQAYQIKNSNEAVASFLVDDAYISPSWYPSKHETARVVPTWNYIAVEARGLVELIDDHDELLSFVDTLTNRHEADRLNAWKTSDAPSDYISSMLKGIVGLRLSVQSLSGAWKVGQNKVEADRLGAAQGVRSEGNTTIANAMESI